MRKGGSWFWANVVVTAVYDDAGALHGFAKITRDLTERRRLDGQQHQLALLAERERIAGGLFVQIVQGLVAVARLILIVDARRMECMDGAVLRHGLQLT